MRLTIALKGWGREQNETDYSSKGMGMTNIMRLTIALKGWGREQNETDYSFERVGQRIERDRRTD